MGGAVIRREARCASIYTYNILYTSRLPMLLAGHTSVGPFSGDWASLVFSKAREPILSHQIRVTRAHVKAKSLRLAWYFVFSIIVSSIIFSPRPGSWPPSLLCCERCDSLRFLCSVLLSAAQSELSQITRSYPSITTFVGPLPKL